jgi:hypothetical protein
MGCGGRFLSHKGFTVVELMIGVGLMSIVVLVMAEMTNMSAKSSLGSAASGQLNASVSNLVNLVNSTTQPNPGTPSGCTLAFIGYPMDFGGNSPRQGLFITSPMNTITTVRPSPSIAARILQITTGNVGSPSPGPTPTIPPPMSNLQIVSINFTQVIDWNFAPADPTKLGETGSDPSTPPIVGLFNLEIQAQKVGNAIVSNVTGGNTYYIKDVLVTLWLDPSAGYTVTRCGI